MRAKGLGTIAKSGKLPESRPEVALLGENSIVRQQWRQEEQWKTNNSQGEKPHWGVTVLVLA
jgi:hypothetical protein